MPLGVGRLTYKLEEGFLKLAWRFSGKTLEKRWGRGERGHVMTSVKGTVFPSVKDSSIRVLISIDWRKFISHTALGFSFLLFLIFSN